jgi:pimeloyl-ACP methyl ester carboxylesterase
MSNGAPDPVIADTARGPVEYADIGDGPPVLAIHGTPGGWDQGLLLAGCLIDAGMRAIIPSRPGALGTPIASGRTWDEQADLFAALLDALQIDRAGIIGWSGGGPSTYRFAVRHPDRVAGVVAFACVSKRLEGHDSLSERLMFATNVGNWLLRALAAHAPDNLVKSTLASEGSLTKEELEQRVAEVLGDEEKKQFVLDLDKTASDYKHRHDAYDNDMKLLYEIDSLELERIATPTLIVHGSADTDVTPDHGEYAAATIPGAQRLIMERGTHLCLYTHPEADKAQARVAEFLRAAAGQ